MTCTFVYCHLGPQLFFITDGIDNVYIVALVTMPAMDMYTVHYQPENSRMITRMISTNDNGLILQSKRVHILHVHVNIY